MFYWPFDHWIVVLALLGGIAAVLGLLWKRTQNRRFVQALAVVAGLLAVFFLIRLVWKTPAQKMERGVEEIVKAINAKDEKGVLEHVSTDFNHPPALTRDSLPFYLKMGWEGNHLDGASAYAFTGFEMLTPTPEGRPTAAIRFKFTSKEDFTKPYLDCRVIFVRDPDGQWRLKDFETPRYALKDEPILLPGIGP